MIIEINDVEARLLYAIVLEKAREHLKYAKTSELTERLFKLATDILLASRDVQPANNGCKKVTV
jgi:transposase